MAFDIEKMLLELAQTNIIPKNIAGHQFQLMTLTNSIREELEELDDLASLINKAANYGLSIKSERAIDFDNMSEEKLDVFWSNKAFDTESETSIREQFGIAVLELSEMEDLIELLTPDEDEEVSTESLLEDAVSYNPTA